MSAWTERVQRHIDEVAERNAEITVVADFIETRATRRAAFLHNLAEELAGAFESSPIAMKPCPSCSIPVPANFLPNQVCSTCLHFGPREKRMTSDAGSITAMRLAAVRS